MRHGTAQRRSRGGRGQAQQGRRGGGGGPNRNQVFDSNGPDVRIRGTAHQILEKYAALAKDAASSGDHVMAEAYLQHAEHYQRVINSWDDMAEIRQQEQQDEHMDMDRFAQRRPASTTTSTGTQAGAPVKPAAQPVSDLGLPASILGEKRVTETVQMETADA